MSSSAAAADDERRLLHEWLGRYDAERFQPAFEARGLRSVSAIVQARLSALDLEAMGVAPLWKRTSILSGVVQEARDLASASNSNWASFDDDGGAAAALPPPTTASPPQPQIDLIGMLGEGAWTDREEDRSISLSFGIEAAANTSVNTSSHRSAGGAPPPRAHERHPSARAAERACACVCVRACAAWLRGRSRAAFGTDLLFDDDGGGASTSASMPNYRVAAPRATVRASFETSSRIVGELSQGQVPAVENPNAFGGR
jgi:hypothetical protein